MLPQNEAATRSESGLAQLLVNAGWLLLAYVLPRVFTFGAVILAARLLGTRDFGAYGTAAAYAVILSILSTLGMSPMLIREIARNPADASALLRAANVVKAVTNLVMLAMLWFIAGVVLKYPPMVVHAALWLGVGYAIGAFAENYAAYFQALEQMHVWMQASALFGLLSGLTGAILISTTHSVVWFSAAFAVGQSACLAWLMVRTPKAARGFQMDGGMVTRLLRSLAPFAAAFIALTVYYKADVLVLAHFRASEEVGEYSAAYKFIDIIQALAIVAASAIYPRLARTAPRGTASGPWTGSRAAELMLVATVPVGAVLWLMRVPLIHFMYGSAYHGSTAALGFLAPAIPALALNILAGSLFAATGRMDVIAKGYIACAVVKVGADWILIPAFGAPGAAAGMLIAECGLTLFLLAALRVTARVKVTQRAAGTAFYAAVACGATLLVPDPSGGLIRTVLFLVATGAGYWKLGVLPEQDRRALSRVFSPRTKAESNVALEAS